MKKIAFALLLPGVLAACGTTASVLGNVSIGAAADDSQSQVTVTKTVSATTGTTYTYDLKGSTSFTFTSRPGSDAAYITGYKITRDSINGTSVGASDLIQKINVYVPSGYTCSSVSQTQSCPYNDSGTTRANGVTSAATNIDFATALEPYVISTNASAYRDLDIEFYGTSANGTSVTIPVSHVIAVGVKAGAQ